MLILLTLRQRKRDPPPKCDRCYLIRPCQPIRGLQRITIRPHRLGTAPVRVSQEFAAYKVDGRRMRTHGPQNNDYKTALEQGKAQRTMPPPQTRSGFSNYNVISCHLPFAAEPLAYPSPPSQDWLWLRGSFVCVKLARKWDDQLQMTRQEPRRYGG